MRIRERKGQKVTALFRIRGQDQDAVEWPCEDWQQAIQKACCVIPHFEQRNPWLYFDTGQRKLYVLLDPETEVLAGTPHPKRTSSQVRSMTKKGELW